MYPMLLEFLHPTSPGLADFFSFLHKSQPWSDPSDTSDELALEPGHESIDISLKALTESIDYHQHA
jgi:hypothetical protein